MNETTIDHKRIKPVSNYVLVQPDETMEKYHLDGKETSIYVGRSFMKYIDEHDSLDFEQKETVDTHAHHWPITGKVIAIPEKNVFRGRDVRRMKDSIPDDVMTPDDLKAMQDMTRNSLNVDSPVEVSAGDTVIFDYLVNINCYDEGMYFHTDIGTLLLIKYDVLIGRIGVDDGNVFPLNGNIFFEWDQPDKIGSVYVPEKEMYDAYGVLQGIVSHVGTDLSHFLRGSQMVDVKSSFSEGDRIFFMAHDCVMVESPFHLHIFEGRKIYTIRRNDIIAKVERIE